jgi:hypothetical protein
MKKEVWFGLTIMALVVLSAFVLLPPPSEMANGHLGLLMLALVVVAIMLGFPTAFTLMGMGMIFAWIAYRSANPDLAVQQTLDLMVQRAFSVMSNDVLISIPLFVFMGYLIERANLIEKLFKSMHLAMARVPGSLAVATIVTCAIFATATGIVGAVVTLMGLLALPAMLRAGYSVQLSAGAITAGGCLGILIPPSVMLIVYGATAGVSVVKLYAGAFFPGLMLATLYVLYVIIIAKIKPSMAPPMSAEDRIVPLPAFAQVVSKDISTNVLPGLIGALKGKRNAAVPMRDLLNHLVIALLPLLAVAAIMGTIYFKVTAPLPVEAVEGVVAMGGELADSADAEEEAESVSGLSEPEADGLQTPPAATQEAKADTVPASEPAKEPETVAVSAAAETPAASAERQEAPLSFWIGHPHRSGGHGFAGWLAAGCGLPQAQLCGAARVGVPHSQNQCHGVLVVCGLQHFLGSVCFAGWSRDHQHMGAGHGPDACAVHDPGASGHLLAGMAFGVDRDHRDFHADLHPLVAPLRHRPTVLRPVGGPEPADRIPEPTCGHGSVLPEGCESTPRHAEPDLCGHVAFHGDPGFCDRAALHVPGHRHVVA